MLRILFDCREKRNEATENSELTTDLAAVFLKQFVILEQIV